MTSVVLHAHLYQPSREDPWTGAWPDQPSAAPFRTWNDRISAECYAPMAAARLLGPEGRRRGVVNTYEHLSFDMGPTLLQWLRANRRVVHDAVAAADRAQVRRGSGAGGAMAQGFHHAILPLCDDADRRTEIAWGLADFRARFGRDSLGFWAPETALDTPTLEALARQGVRFVVVAPRQVEAVRPPEGAWQPAAHTAQLSRRAYRVDLPDGGHIALLPYDGDLAQSVAFGGALHDGEGFGRRLVDAAVAAGPDGLVHLATDGESYGHHHARGEMALARAIEVLQHDPRVTLTTYEAWLADHPPTWEARLVEHSSWSCAHGVERWRSDCGCHVGGGVDWHQAWRAPLRAAFDRLRDAAREAMAHRAAEVFRDPAAARDAYVDVVHDADHAQFRAWYLDHAASASPTAVEQRDAHAILEIHRHLLAMYTSCGWFFDDATGIEMQQNVRHAACAVGLLELVFGVDLGGALRADLERVPCNEHQGLLPALLDEARRVPPPAHARHVPGALDALVEEGTPAAAPTHPASAFPREAGVLLHVTSLPGAGPCGDLDAALDAVDFLHHAGVGIWQVLPLSPTDGAGSPYSTWSSRSGNPHLIGLRPLVEAGLLSPDEASRPPEPPRRHIDWDLVKHWKEPLLFRAAERLATQPEHPWSAHLDAFVARRPWILDAGRFHALKQAHDGAPWWAWPPPLRDREPEALTAFEAEHAVAIRTWCALELFFLRQWRAVHTYAASRGVTLFGDIPIYVGQDSVDVWAAPHLFQVDTTGRPTHVSGVPPDAFSVDGQRWGNPLFDWAAMAEDDYGWWRQRLGVAFGQCDVVRLDHFIGFVRHWSIPADQPATEGTWLPSPGADFFAALEKHLGPLPLVVEDLGEVGPDVRALQESLGAPGMRLVQFGLDGNLHNDHLPRNHPERSVAYAGTHDNDTTLGWWDALAPHERGTARGFFRHPGGHPGREVTDLVLHSRAAWAVLTAQDLLDLGSEARFNVPGTLVGNWSWRLERDRITRDLARQLRGRLAEADRLTPFALERHGP